MKRILIVTGLCLAALLNGCFFYGDRELVMPKGMVIKATNGSGTMKIEAVGKYARTYSWNGKKKTFKLIPLSWERWAGSKGLISPDGDREMHVVLQEGQQHFSSQEEVYPWLNLRCGTNAMYTPDGLVVSWREEIHPTVQNYLALLVDVWQIYVNGKKPTGLRGASYWAIKVQQPDSAEVFIGKPLINTAKNINGRNYYGKTLDFMDECKISPDLVEKLISSVSARPDGLYTCYSGWGPEDRALRFSVWLDSDGNVVFVNGR